jgi:hypothetical protein
MLLVFANVSTIYGNTMKILNYPFSFSKYSAFFLTISFCLVLSQFGYAQESSNELSLNEAPVPAVYQEIAELEDYALALQKDIVDLLDFQTGRGTGALARHLAKIAQDIEARSENISVDAIQSTGLTFDVLRRFILEMTEGAGLVVPVVNHLPAIRKANERLRGAGIDFIKIVQAAEVDNMIPAYNEPVTKDQAAYARFMKARLAVSISVAIVGGLAGSGFSVPGLAGAVTAAGLETQFAVFSRRWAVFWEKFGFPGNIFINAMYGIIVSASHLTAEAALGQTPSLNFQEFLVKSVFIGTATFVASFGAMQIAAAKMLKNGEFSEYRRFAFENYSVFWNNFGRIVALSAAGLGVQYEVMKVYGLSFGVGEFVGWGIQLSYLSAITAPMWIRLLIGDKIFDRVTEYRLKHKDNPQHPWNRGIWGKVKGYCAMTFAAPFVSFYTPNR